MFLSTGCDPRVSSCVHTQPFGRWATDWRWFLPLRSSVLPRLPPCGLIASLLQWWGYRLLIAIKPLRASCVLSPAASWQHSNKLLPCTQRGSPSLWTWSSQPSCHSGQPNMNLCLIPPSDHTLATVCPIWFTNLQALFFCVCEWVRDTSYTSLTPYHPLPQCYQQITYIGLFPVGSW